VGTTTTARPSFRQRLFGLVLVTHPIPSALYVVAVAVFSWLASQAAGRTLQPGTLVLVLASVACAQAAIGATNDFCDRYLDALSRPEKPIVRGWISPGEAIFLAAIATVGVVGLLAPLGPIPFLLGALIEGLGLAYDFGLKGTPFSALLYAVYFPLIPLLAWAVFGRWQPFLPWLLPLGAALGIAMNVANSLPDLESDLESGVSGLPHVLGLRRGLAVAWTLPLAALVLVVVLDVTGAVPARPVPLFGAVGAGVISTGAAVALYVRSPSARTLRFTFVVQALGCVAIGIGWLAAVAF
jgi:4-hydroxybenzoate polyprenyltransferase